MSSQLESDRVDSGVKGHSGSTPHEPFLKQISIIPSCCHKQVAVACKVAEIETSAATV